MLLSGWQVVDEYLMETTLAPFSRDGTAQAKSTGSVRCEAEVWGVAHHLVTFISARPTPSPPGLGVMGSRKILDQPPGSTLYLSLELIYLFASLTKRRRRMHASNAHIFLVVKVGKFPIYRSEVKVFRRKEIFLERAKGFDGMQLLWESRGNLCRQASKQDKSPLIFLTCGKKGGCYLRHGLPSYSPQHGRHLLLLILGKTTFHEDDDNNDIIQLSLTEEEALCARH